MSLIDEAEEREMSRYRQGYWPVAVKPSSREPLRWSDKQAGLAQVLVSGVCWIALLGAGIVCGLWILERLF